MDDYSSGHISTEEARDIMNTVEERLGRNDICSIQASATGI